MLFEKHTQKSPHFISFRAWFGRASRCTLRGNRESRTEVKSFVHQDARYEEIGESRTVVESFVLRGNRESRIGIHYSCNKLHATRESWIAYRGWIFHATSCTLRGNRESRTVVDSFVHRDARYEGIGESHTEVESFVHQNARYEEIGESRIEVESFVQQVARYIRNE